MIERVLRTAPFLLAPLMVGAGMVLGKYADTGAHWTVVIRPVLVLMAGALLVQMVLLLLRQSPSRSAAIAIVVLFLLSGGRSGLAVIGVGCAITVLWFARTRRLPNIPRGIAFVLAATFLLASGGQVLANGAITAEDFSSESRVHAGTPGTNPSIYVLVLDAYARQDTLAEMGFDNEPFLAALEQRSFDVYRDSRSNYTWTASTLASMLNARPIDEIAGLPAPGSPDRGQTRSLRRSINDAVIPRLLREQGYRIVSIPPLADYVGLRNADVVLDSGQLTEFEIHLLQDTTLAGFLNLVAPDFIGAQHRDRIIDAFADFGPQPITTFLWAHVISPHQPFVFDPAGNPVLMPECFPGCWFWEPWDEFSAAEFATGFVTQVQYVNRETLDAVDRVIRGDPDAVMVVMGDHGSRGVPTDPDEQFRNLLAVRSPGFPQLLGEAPTPVNVLGAILGAYLDISLPRWPDDQYAGRHLDAVRIAPIH